MKSPTLLFASIVFSTTCTYGTVVFQNTGTLSGWDYVTHEGKGSITQVSSPTYKGSTAVKATQVYQPTGDQSVHSELGKRDVGKNGWDRYYGWAFYLPSNLANDSTVRDQIMQLAADTACRGQQTEVLIYS